MSAVSVVPYKEISIVYTDLSNMQIDEAIKGINETRGIIPNYPENSVYSMMNISEVRYNVALQNEIAEVAKLNGKHVKATVIVGLSPITKLMAKATIKLTGRKAAIFDDVESGKEWLYQVHLGNK
ncbi:MAG: hypothetical protein OCD76_19065 [Reichenbachiella sp.]